MTRRRTTIPAPYFDALFSADPDPWRFRTSDYERDKYAATLAALRRPRYPHAIEVGCANGAFTRLLASRCDALVALDASTVALALARSACADLANVRFVAGAVPHRFPAGRYDLIVASEVLYYLEAEDVLAFARMCATASVPGGDVVICHWLGETDYPLTGHEASDLFLREMVRHGFASSRLQSDVYRLERLSRTGAPVEADEQTLGAGDLDRKR